MQIRVAPARRPARPSYTSKAPSGAIVQMRAPPGVPPGGTFGLRARRTTTVQSYAAPKPVAPRPVAPTPSRPAPTPYRPPPQQYKAAPLSTDGRHLHQESKSDVRRQLVEVEVLCWESKLLCVHAVLLLLLHGSSVYRQQITVGIGKVRKVPTRRAAGECLLIAPFGLCVPWGRSPNHGVRQNEATSA